MGCVWVYIQKVELRHWWEYGDKKTGINWFQENCPLVRIRGADLEDKFLF